MALQRVRPFKLETVNAGGGQNDENLTETNIGEDYLDAQGVAHQLPGASTSTADAAVYTSRATDSSLAFTDIPSGTLRVRDLLTSVLGKPGSHASTPDVIHWLSEGPGDGFASGAMRTATLVGVLPSVVTWWASSAQKVRLFTVAYTYTGVLVAKRVSTLYMANAPVRTVTDTYDYGAGIFAPNIARTWA